MVAPASKKLLRAREERSSERPDGDQSMPPGDVNRGIAGPFGPRMNRIAKRAEEIYEARGGRQGKAMEDWLQAEREVDMQMWGDEPSKARLCRSIGSDEPAPPDSGTS